MGKQRRRALRCWSYTRRPNAVKRLPALTTLEPDEGGYWRIVPDLEALDEAHYSGEVVDLGDCDENYRGLAVEVSDHGNVELVFRFRNGNTRSIWSMV